MGSVSIEKITLMLDVYRKKLEQAETPPIDYALCLRLSAQISLLEDLFYLAHQSAAQQGVQSDVVTRCEGCGAMLADGGVLCFECANVA